MVEQHQGFRAECLVLYLIRNQDGVGTQPCLYGPSKDHVLPKQFSFPHLPLHGNHILVPVKVSVRPRMFGRRCPHPAMHGVIPAIHIAGRADCFQAAGEQKPAHDTSLGFLSMGVIMPPPHQPGLCHK